MSENLLLFFSACIVNNFVLTHFLGLCPFIGVSNHLKAAGGMGVATTFVLLITALACYLVNNLVLAPLDWMSLELIVDIVVIATTVQLVEIIIKSISYGLYNSLGIYLPLITTNCIVLGLVLLNTQQEHNLTQSLVYAFGAGCGFALVLILFAAIRERLTISDVPEPFKGSAIALITAGLMSMAFMAFSNFEGV